MLCNCIPGKTEILTFHIFSQRARSKAGFLLAEKTVTFSTFINIIWKDTEKHVIKRINFVFILFRRYNIEKLGKNINIQKVTFIFINQESLKFSLTRDHLSFESIP